MLCIAASRFISLNDSSQAIHFLGLTYNVDFSLDRDYVCEDLTVCIGDEQVRERVMHGVRASNLRSHSFRLYTCRKL